MTKKTILLNSCVLFLSFLPFNSFAEPLNYGLISLNENASQTVARDEMVLTLSIEEQGKDREQIANLVTNKLNTVLRQAKNHTDFNTTLRYRSAYPMSDYVNGKRINKGWQDSAQIEITSKNIAALNEFAATIQNQAAIANIQYVVSRQTLAQHQKQLTDEAINQFKTRANQITQALGGSRYKVVQLTIGNSSNTQSNSFATLRFAPGYSSAKDTAPAQDNAPGETQLNLDINGQIQVINIP